MVVAAVVRSAGGDVGSDGVAAVDAAGACRPGALPCAAELHCPRWAVNMRVNSNRDSMREDDIINNHAHQE
jgi:hypothetical protein